MTFSFIYAMLSFIAHVIAHEKGAGIVAARIAFANLGERETYGPIPNFHQKLTAVGARQMVNTASSIKASFMPEWKTGVITVCLPRMIEAEVASRAAFSSMARNGEPIILPSEKEEKVDRLYQDLGEQRSLVSYFEGGQAHSLLWDVGRWVADTIKATHTFKTVNQLVVISHAPLLQMTSLSFRHDLELQRMTLAPGDFYFLDLCSGKYEFPTPVA